MIYSWRSLDYEWRFFVAYCTNCQDSFTNNSISLHLIGCDDEPIIVALVTDAFLYRNASRQLSVESIVSTPATGPPTPFRHPCVPVFRKDEL